MTTTNALFNWKRRALIAENKLRKMGVHVPGMQPDDDWYLVNTLEHQDGHTPVTIDELNDARERLIEQGRYEVDTKG